MTLTVAQELKGTSSFPTRVVFGSGAVQQLCEVARTVGMKRPLLVTDAGLVRSGMAAKVTAVLDAGGLQGSQFDGVEANPTEASVFPGRDCYEHGRCDGIIALGGGSPLDAAKAIRLVITHRRPLEEYDDLIGGDQHITADMPPMIAIPTTAGTGSEVSRSTVIGLASTGRKTVIFSPHLIPNVAVADPELTVGLPAHLTAFTGADALTHNVEAYLSKGFHPMCDAVALYGIRRVGQWLRRAVQHGQDVEARSWMLMASLMGAVAFQKGLGATHSLAHPLSSVAHLHHGQANAIMLPHVLRFNQATSESRLADVARALEVEPTADAAIEAIERLLRDISVPRRLSEAGVTAEMIPQMVPLAVQDGCHQLNPRPCTAADFEAMYREAL